MSRPHPTLRPSLVARLFPLASVVFLFGACGDTTSKTQPLDITTGSPFDITYPDTDRPPADTVTPPVDTVTPPADTVTPPVDTVTPPADTVTPPVDTVTPPVDTVTPPVDTVTPPVDTVTPPVDTVTPPADVGPDVVCTPFCAANSCGDNGCGTPCACTGGKVCNQSTLQCGAPVVQGNTCASAIPLTAGPNGSFVGSGDLKTPGLTDNYQRGNCGVAGYAFTGAGAPDQAFVFTPPTSGQWTVAVTSVAGVDSAFTLYDGRVCGEIQCLGGADNGYSGGVDTFTFTLTGNVVYTLVVDSFIASAGGAFTIAVTPGGCIPVCGNSCGISDGCGGTCGCGDGFVCNTSNSTCVVEVQSGDDCNQAIRLVLSPDGETLKGSGDLTTVGLTDAIDPDVCTLIGTSYSHSGQSTKEQVFWFEAPISSENYIIRVLPEADVDISLVLYRDRPCNAANCMGYLDTGFRGDPEAARATLVAGKIYYVVVESFSPTIAPGAFNVVVELPKP